MSLRMDDPLQKILMAGILAPSADNRHLFRYRLAGDQILLTPSDRYVEANAQTRLLAWISFGTVVENISIQAAAFGIVAQPTWFPRENIICEIALLSSGTLPDTLVDAIPRRHTNRRLLFKGPPLDNSQREELERQVSAIPGARLIWLDSPDLRSTALHLIRLAETERFRSHALHEELFASLRFDVGHRSTCAEGIPIGAAELDPPARLLFPALRSWSLMRALNLLRAHALIGWRAAWLPAHLAPHIGLIVGTGVIQLAAAQAGRGFQRLWLTATKMDLALQPFAAAALYALPHFCGVSEAVRRELREGWLQVESVGTPMMGFRLGRAAPPSVTSGRPPLDHFLEPA